MRSFSLWLFYFSSIRHYTAEKVPIIPKLCTLPPYPANGRYEVLNPETPDPSPGDKQTTYTLEVTCDPGYHNVDNAILVCWDDGTINGELSECLPYCTRQKNDVMSCGVGKVGEEVRCIAPTEHTDFLSRYTLDEKKEEEPECGISNRIEVSQVISGGRSATFEELPWHAGIYTKKKRPYMQICGGSLVSHTVVISAAHCFWSEIQQQLPASDYAVTVGKLYRPWNDPNDDNAQKSDVAGIKIPPHFQGHITNLQDDIALVIVANPFTFNYKVRPVCLDFNVDMDKKQLAAGQLGKVAGWGLTGADGKPSPVLKVVELPVVNISECFQHSDPVFRSHITSDKICAGYMNGTAVCKGDSGGGLSFPEEQSGRLRYYLRGIVSGSPQSEHLCNTLAWASFTHLLTHEHFIRETVTETATSAAEAVPVLSPTSLY